MKKIYLKPEMEMTECCMLKTAICSNTDVLDNNQTSNPSVPGPPTPTPAPGRVF